MGVFILSLPDLCESTTRVTVGRVERSFLGRIPIHPSFVSIPCERVVIGVIVSSGGDMTERSQVNRVEQLIKEGDFAEARRATENIDPRTMSAEELHTFEKLERALKADPVISGAVLLLLVIWIGTTVSAI